MKALKGLLLVAILGIIASTAWAQSAGKITEIQGEVKIIRAGQEISANLGSEVMVGDEIVTGAGSKARIWFRDESTISLGDKTRFRVDALDYKPGQTRRSYFSLLSGKCKAVVGGWFGKSKEPDYQIKALSTVAGVRGTVPIIEIKGEGDQKSVFFASDGGEFLVWSEDDPAHKVSVPAGYFLEVLLGGKVGEPGLLSDELLELLRGLFALGEDASGERSDELFGEYEPEGADIEELVEILELLGVFPGQGEDYSNPSDLIFQEPPGFTPVIVNVTIPL